MEFCCSEVPMQVKESITRLKNKTNVAETHTQKKTSAAAKSKSVTWCILKKKKCTAQLRNKKTKDDIMKFKTTKLIPRSRKTST